MNETDPNLRYDDYLSPDFDSIEVDDPVGLYLKEMGQVPLLTREEEISLAKEMEAGRAAQEILDSNGHNPEELMELEETINKGVKAREHLIKANTRLVVSIAKKYRGRGLPFLDLIQAGNLGLMRAADKFDQTLGNRFATYATWWIRQSISRTLKQNSRNVALPVHTVEQINAIGRVSRRLEQELGRSPSPEEIAEEMGKKTTWVRDRLVWARTDLSLEMPVGDGEDSELGDFIENEAGVNPEALTQKRLLSEAILASLNHLEPREVRILELRFGLNNHLEHTLEEVGDKLGLTRERIRQIQKWAFKKLRHPRIARELREYL